MNQMSKKVRIMNIPPEPFFFPSNSPFLRMLTNQFSGLNWQLLLSLFFILLLIGAYYFVHEFIVSIFQSTTIIQTSDSHQAIIYGKILDTLFNIFPIRNSPQQNIWMNKIMLYPIDPFLKTQFRKQKADLISHITASYSFWSLKSINIWFLIFRILINCI